MAFATEAGHASLDWAFAQLDADHVISLIAPGNERSRRVAERLGETYEGRTRVRGHLVHIYGIDRPSYAQPPPRGLDVHPSELTAGHVQHLAVDVVRPR